MVSIDVDFDVFKELTARRRSELMTENEVLREALSLSKPSRGAALPTAEGAGGIALVSKGVSFLHGTEFRAPYKGKLHTGIVNNGALVIGGRRFKSLSAAAVSITGNPVNGWRFWECLVPGTSKWKVAAQFR